MRICFAGLMLSLICFAGIQVARTAEDANEPGLSGADAAELEEAARKFGVSIRHRRLILLRLKQDAGRDAMEEVATAIKELPSNVEGIRALEWGRISGPREADRGFTHCLLLSFDDAKARDALADHPAYQEFERQLRPHLDESIVIDYRPEGRFWRPSRPVLPENDIQ